MLRVISSSLTLVRFGRPANLFRVAKKCVQNAVTVVLGAKASASRQPMKYGCMYTPNISSLIIYIYIKNSNNYDNNNNYNKNNILIIKIIY